MTIRALRAHLEAQAVMARVWVYPPERTVMVLAHPQDIRVLTDILESVRPPGVLIEVLPLRFWDYWFLTKQKIAIKEIL